MILQHDLAEDMDEVDSELTALRRPQTADREEPRPFTSAAKLDGEIDSKSRSGFSPGALVEYSARSVADGGGGKFKTGRYLSLNITATWGDAHYLGKIV